MSLDAEQTFALALHDIVKALVNVWVWAVASACAGVAGGSETDGCTRLELGALATAHYEHSIWGNLQEFRSLELTCAGSPGEYFYDISRAQLESSATMRRRCATSLTLGPKERAKRSCRME